MIALAKKIIEKLPKRKDIVPLIISIGITIVFLVSYYFWGSRVIETMGIAVAIAWFALILLIMVIAGFTVLKTLFLFAAELSLLIFLAQSFCSVTQRSIASNEAMQNLLIVGILYIIFMFFRSLWKTLKDYYKKVENEKWSIEKIFTVSLFLIFSGWFLWEIYLVISPIIRNLCIYNQLK
jgi:hypothetical protein